VLSACQLQCEAVWIASPYRMEEAPNRRKTDRLRVGVGEVDRRKTLGLPQGTGSDHPLAGNHRVHDGNVAPLARANAHLDHLVGGERILCCQLSGRIKAHSQRTHRGLAHLREGVIRSSG